MQSWTLTIFMNIEKTFENIMLNGNSWGPHTYKSCCTYVPFMFHLWIYVPFMLRLVPLPACLHGSTHGCNWYDPWVRRMGSTLAFPNNFVADSSQFATNSSHNSPFLKYLFLKWQGGCISADCLGKCMAWLILCLAPRLAHATIEQPCLENNNYKHDMLTPITK